MRGACAGRTEVARRLLPDLVPHRDAAANAGRSALLVAVLTQRSAEPPEETAGALLAATRDWLHQDYRAPAMPETCALVGRRGRPASPPSCLGRAPRCWRC